MTERGAATTRRPVAAALVALGIAIALVGAWLVPPLAVAVVWPLLFVVPGWGIMAVVRPRISAAGRLGLAIVLSLAISAHLVYWLSLASGGYRRETIFFAAVLLALPVPLAAWRGGAAGLIAQGAASVRALRRDPVAFGLAGVAAGFVGLVLDSGLWKAAPGGISAGGSNWSDLGVHLSISQSLNAGNFPPQVPYFAGEPLVYHWFADFHAAIAARAADFFSVPSFVVSSAILTGALALLVHGLARALLRGRGARRAAALAVVLVVIGGGLGWVRLIADVAAGLGDPISLVTHNSYDNAWLTEWPYFRIPSVMGTGLLVHRATTAGLPMLVGAVLLLVTALPSARARASGARDRPLLIVLAGLLGALLAPFHFFFFPAFLGLALAWVVIGGRLFERTAPRNAALLLAPYLLALPFAVAPLLQAGTSGDLKPVIGWDAAPIQDGPVAVAFFYATNLGVPFLLALAALLAPGTPRRVFLAGWVLLLFAVPNLVQLSVVSFDMNKYFQAMWIAVAILAAWLIRRWPAPALAAVLLLSVPSPLLVSAWTALNREVVLGWSEVEAWRWISDNTPEEAVFVTNGWLNSPTDAAGRLRVLTYTVYIANLGYSPDRRAAQVDEIYCSGDAERAAELSQELGAAYLLDTGPPRACEPRTDFATGARWTLAFENDRVRIWRLTPTAIGAVSSVTGPAAVFSLSFGA
ncbi:MAG: hypothetical protein WED12_00285 [Chloroflexota bacterium]